MADSEQFQMRVSPEWLAMVDDARGVLTRSAFVKLAVSDSSQMLLATSTREERRGAVPVVRTFTPEAPPEVQAGPVTPQRTKRDEAREWAMEKQRKLNQGKYGR